MTPDSTIALSTPGDHLQKAFGLVFRAEAHHALDAGPVVPAAVEDHDLPGCRQVRDVALGIHLRLLALRRRRECHHPEDARAYPLRHRFDCATLTCPVAPLEQDANLQARMHHPLLELDELDMQACEFSLVFLSLEVAVGCGIIVPLIGHRFPRMISG
jgi:hypothetical protein